MDSLSQPKVITWVLISEIGRRESQKKRRWDKSREWCDTGPFTKESELTVKAGKDKKIEFSPRAATRAVPQSPSF